MEFAAGIVKDKTLNNVTKKQGSKALLADYDAVVLVAE